MYAHGFVYVFRDVQIVVYDVGECHMSVVIDPERDRLSLWLCIDIVVLLVYFWGNNQNIITNISFKTTLHTLTSSQMSQPLQASASLENLIPAS